MPNVSIDARQLTYGGFVLPGTTPDWIITHAPFHRVLDLAPGLYAFQVQSGEPAPFDFTVETDGSVSYDRRLPYLAGHGTNTLVVEGLPVTISASLLRGGRITLANAHHSTPFLTDGPVRVLPGSHLVGYGSGQDADIVFTINPEGTFDYDRELDQQHRGCLEGAGTATLTFLGFPIVVDARPRAAAVSFTDVDAAPSGPLVAVRLLPYVGGYEFTVPGAPPDGADPRLHLSVDGTYTLSTGLSEVATIDFSGVEPLLTFHAANELRKS